MEIYIYIININNYIYIHTYMQFFYVFLMYDNIRVCVCMRVVSVRKTAFCPK